jgi:hypothetical protein
MSTVLFVHGTGVRRESYEKALAQIQKGMRRYHPVQLEVEGCLWGDPVGTKLNADGLSIPEYGARGGSEPLTEEEVEIALWMHLYSDPLYELRVLSLRPVEQKSGVPGKLPPGERLDRLVRALTFSPELLDKLQQGDIDAETIQSAHTEIMGSIPYQEMLKAVVDPMGVFQTAVSKAIVARAILRYENTQERSPAIHTDAWLRDEVVKLIRDRLGPYQAGPVEWIVKKLLGPDLALAWGGVKRMGTSFIKWRRGAVMDGTSPAAGDILLYQSRGERIRDFIRRRIQEVPSPVVAIAHSLGGVALVDLLIKEDLREQVGFLVTVGSQAPYFYEIDALQALPYGQELPAHFPRWVNVYDLRDFLSFRGEGISQFQGRVKDYGVDNKQPFPESHSAYWSNPETYKIISQCIFNEDSI